jgi:oligopeptide transport system ATP-binding protein
MTEPDTSSAPLLDVEDLSLGFAIGGGFRGRHSEVLQAVDGVSFEIHRGETLGLVGESGSGKSSLGRALLRIHEPTRGRVRFDGQDLSRLDRRSIRELRQRMQLIYQDPYSSLNPKMRVGRILAEPLTIHRLGSKKERDARVLELLEMVALDPEYAARFPHELSGGQRQRVGIAEALSVGPDFVVCDEPVSSLDVSVQAQVLNLLMDLRDALHLTLLFIAHDLSTVRQISHRVAVMYLGQIVEVGLTKSVFELPRHPYTKALLSAAPKPDPITERTRQRIQLRGDMPSAINPPSGCRFHERCWLYEELDHPRVCREEEPALTPNTVVHRSRCHFADQVTDPFMTTSRGASP